jgi:type II secretory pathway pseudopilin PulG
VAPTPAAGRPGFALLAAVAGLVVMVVLGALVVVPLLAVTTDQQRAERTLALLSDLTDRDRWAIMKFQEVVERSPRFLTHLSAPIAGNDPDLCGNTYGNTAGEWEPTADRVHLDTGVPTPMGTIDNQLVPLTIGAQKYLVVRIPGVRIEDARRLDALGDESTGESAGRVRWVVTDAAQGLVTVQWLTPVPPPGFAQATAC